MPAAGRIRMTNLIHSNQPMKTQTPAPPAAKTAGPNGKNGHTPEVIEHLPIAACHISEQNTRPKPDKKDPGIISLAESIVASRQTTPAIVRPHPKKKGEYEICAGARRRVACEVAGLKTLDAIVRNMDDDEFEAQLLIENLQREDPDPKMEVRLLDRMVKRGTTKPSEISAELGKPEHWVERRLGLLKVIEPLRKSWESAQGILTNYTVDMMSLLGGLPVETQKSLCGDSGRPLWVLQNLRNRLDLEKYLQTQVFCSLENPPFPLDDPKYFVKGCGPGCACDSNRQASLFDTGNKGPGRCLNTGCFKTRLSLFLKEKYDAIVKTHGGEKAKSLPIYCEGASWDHGANVFIDGKDMHAPTPDYGYGLTAKEPAGAKAKDSKKVIIVSKDGLRFKAGWLVQGRSDSSGRSKSKPKKKLQQTPAQIAAARAERIKILQGKRWLLVHPEIEKALKAAPWDKCTEDVIDLVAIFGLPHHAQSWTADHHWKLFDARKKDGFPFMPDTPDCVPEYLRNGSNARKIKGRDPDRRGALWFGVKEILLDIIKPGGSVGTYIEKVDDLRRVAKLISFDIDQAKKEADLTIKPPKTWGAIDPHTLKPITTGKAPKPAADEAKPKAKKTTGMTAANRTKLAEAMRARWAAHRRDAAKK